MWKWVIISLLAAGGVWFLFFRKDKNQALKNFAGGGGGVGVAGSSSVGTSWKKSFSDINAQTQAKQESDITGLLTNALTFNFTGVYNSFKSLWTGSGSKDDVEQKKAVVLEYALAGDKQAKFLLSVNYPSLAKEYGFYNIKEGGPALDIKEIVKNANK